MSNLGYREILDTSPLGMKQLNDSLRALWSKVMGGIEEKDLSGIVRKTLNESVNQSDFSTAMEQTRQEISLQAEESQQLDARLRSAESRLSLQADEISAKVSRTEFSALQVGGRNYLPRSKSLDHANYVEIEPPR